MSTGRAGTTFITRALSGLAQNDIEHQVKASRRINILGNLVQARRMSLDQAETLASSWQPGWRNSNADPLRSMLIAASLASSDPCAARIVHLVRDPRDFVTSFMSWKQSSVQRFILHHVLPAWQPNPWLIRESTMTDWARMSKFEHFCWIWNYKNRVFQELERHCSYRRVRIEDIVTPAGAQELVSIVSFVAGDAPYFPGASYTRERVNASPDKFPPWRQWPRSMMTTVDNYCGDLMRMYGYGYEPEWKAAVDNR